jgi:hypothetical protein
MILFVFSLLLQNSANAIPTTPGPVVDCQPCKLSPGAKNPSYTFTFNVQTTKDGDRSIAAINASSSDGKTTQRLAVDDMMPVPRDQPFIVGAEDLNSDGWADLSVVTAAGATNEYSQYWLFLPSTGTYKDLGKYSTLTVDKKRHLITSYETGGMAGLIHESNEYAFVGDDLVITRSEKQDVVDESRRLFRREIRVRKGDKLVLVKSKTIKVK